MIKTKSSETLKLMFCIFAVSVPWFSNMLLDCDMRLFQSYYFCSSLTWRQNVSFWIQQFQSSLESFKSQCEFAEMFAVHIFLVFLRTVASLSLQYQFLTTKAGVIFKMLAL